MVSGIVVITEPGMAEEVDVALSGIAGIEVGGMLDERRIIAVIRADSEAVEKRLISMLKGIRGVSDISRAYHHIESPKNEGRI
jgi:nitrate reductase NapAB chaperone NapD